MYETIYKISPLGLKKIFSYLSLYSGRKPRVKKQDVINRIFPGNKKAEVIFSADFELAWAWRFQKNVNNSYKRAKELADRTRRNFDFLLDLFDKREIPVTWATVGHLFLEKCEAGDHDWMSKIPPFENREWKFDGSDWYGDDPYGNVVLNPEWYAPDLIKKIINSPIEHEIGCHSFSHVDFTDKNCPPEVAEDEIIACLKEAERWNLNFRSFVFPAGTFGNFKILKKHGFLTYRRNPGHELFYPYIDENGLIVLPSSLGLGSNELNHSVRFFRKKISNYIDKAIKHRTVCHFWFHPSLYDDYLNNILPVLLNDIIKYRDNGEIGISTMGGFSEFFKCGENK